LNYKLSCSLNSILDLDGGLGGLDASTRLHLWHLWRSSSRWMVAWMVAARNLSRCRSGTFRSALNQL
jgi:hypothetical protein